MKLRSLILLLLTACTLNATPLQVDGNSGLILQPTNFTSANGLLKTNSPLPWSNVTGAPTNYLTNAGAFDGAGAATAVSNSLTPWIQANSNSISTNSINITSISNSLTNYASKATALTNNQTNVTLGLSTNSTGPWPTNSGPASATDVSVSDSSTTVLGSGTISVNNFNVALQNSYAKLVTFTTTPAAQPTNGHFVTLTTGDSVASYCVSPWETLMQNRFGKSGIQPVFSLSAGATANTGDFTNWVNGNTVTIPTNEYCIMGDSYSTYSGGGQPVPFITYGNASFIFPYITTTNGAGSNTFKVQSTAAGQWGSGQPVITSQQIYYLENAYNVLSGGTLGTNPPTFTNGTNVYISGTGWVAVTPYPNGSTVTNNQYFYYGTNVYLVVTGGALSYNPPTDTSGNNFYWNSPAQLKWVGALPILSYAGSAWTDETPVVTTGAYPHVQAIIGNTNGALTGFNIVNAGWGFTNTPTVTISSNSVGGSNATATCTTNATGGIATMTVTSGGSYNTSGFPIPVVTFSALPVIQTNSSTVDTYWPKVVGAVATVNKTDYKSYIFRLKCTAGTLKIPQMALFRNNNFNGVINLDASQGGVDIGQMKNCNPAIMGPILAVLNPTLITFECKDSAAIFSNSLTAWQNLWYSVTTNADFIDIGPSPATTANATYSTTGNSDQLIQNALLRSNANSANIANNLALYSNALALGRFYFDAYSPCASAAAMGLSGWLSYTDSTGSHLVHPNTSCIYGLASLLFEKTGFSAFCDLTATKFAIQRQNVINNQWSFGYTAPSPLFNIFNNSVSSAGTWNGDASVLVGNEQNYVALKSIGTVTGAGVGWSLLSSYVSGTNNGNSQQMGLTATCAYGNTSVNVVGGQGHTNANFTASAITFNDTATGTKYVAPVISCSANQTYVGGTSGYALFSEGMQGVPQTVMIYCSGLVGTVSYSYPKAFTVGPPTVIATGGTNSLPASMVTSNSLTGCQITGATNTGYIILQGY